jgi:glycosyltransferase involved in cell wall biosynthesis
MRIAQVSPLFESVPPKTYGGTERVVSYLTEELVRQGHEVTLFASGDSVTSARLIATVPQSMRSAGASTNAYLATQAVQVGQVMEMAHAFDIIHFHTGFAHFPSAVYLKTPHLTTVHDRQDLAEYRPLYLQFDQEPLISISNSQRDAQPRAYWMDTVYHGLPEALFAFSPRHEDYFAFLGRISPEKRVDRAIEIAIRCETPIYVAAKVDDVYEEYFMQCIKPLLAHPLVHFLGEVGGADKWRLLAHARALLFPIDWPEPFGLVMIEAMACGTPVVAYCNGAVPEVMEHGVTGFVVANQDAAVAAAMRVDELDRRACRAAFERRFTVERMTEHYLRGYRRLANRPAKVADLRQVAGERHG